MLTMDVRIVQRYKIDDLVRTVMLARPKITDKCQILAVWFVHRTVIETQRDTFQVQEKFGLIV